ncbi:MAG: hypothetical protein KF773_14495, partial [Deltaproteobacteria bacterium]|nr:hypothetical protein [Deltaproteobacteria bacterium]
MAFGFNPGTGARTWSYRGPDNAPRVFVFDDTHLVFTRAGELTVIDRASGATATIAVIDRASGATATIAVPNARPPGP